MDFTGESLHMLPSVLTSFCQYITPRVPVIEPHALRAQIGRTKQRAVQALRNDVQHQSYSPGMDEVQNLLTLVHIQACHGPNLICLR